VLSQIRVQVKSIPRLTESEEAQESPLSLIPSLKWTASAGFVRGDLCFSGTTSKTKKSHVVKDLAGSDSIRRGACVTHKIEKQNREALRKSNPR
jgi:hypothetical protein